MDNILELLFSAVISALTAISIIYIQRHIQNKKDKETKNLERENALKLYSHPIIRASEQLAWRLKEILDYKARFLLNQNRENDYYYYKTNSTTYRLCALLGWLQASKRENSYFNTESLNQHHSLQNAIGDFRKYLADGSHIEVSILQHLSKQFNIDIERLNKDQETRLGVEIEGVIFNYIGTSIKSDVKELSLEKKLDMINDVLLTITSKVNKTPINKIVIHENIETASNEISRKFWWIYRDWQYAVGDIMISKTPGAQRMYDIIGYGEFLEIIENGDIRKKKWVLNISKLFEKLDVSINDRFDARVEQLEHLYIKIIAILEAFKQIESNQNTITENSLQTLKEFALKLEILHKRT